MARFSKTFNLSLPEGKECVANRMVKRLKSAESDGRGKAMDLMRVWMQAGYLMEEIGQGLADQMLAMDREGVFTSMTHKQQADVLIKMVEHKVWQYGLMKEAKRKEAEKPAREIIEETEPVKEQKPEPEPEKKPGIRPVANLMA